jgi:Ni/Fe-hydrogenase subunit HybB-like protein
LFGIQQAPLRFTCIAGQNRNNVHVSVAAQRESDPALNERSIKILPDAVRRKSAVSPVPQHAVSYDYVPKEFGYLVSAGFLAIVLKIVLVLELVLDF